MVSVFIHNADRFLEQHIREALENQKGEDQDIIIRGTQSQGDVNSKDEYDFIKIDNTIEELHKALAESDVIIYNITDETAGCGNSKEALQVAIYLLKERIQDERKRKLICVSSMFSWANTIKEYQDDANQQAKENTNKAYIPFDIEESMVRQPHEGYRKIYELEKQVKSLKGPQLDTYVAFCGMLYGCGEQLLHRHFKSAWSGDASIPLLGEGSNYLPMIHVKDAAGLVTTLAMTQEKDEDRYTFLVDKTHLTLKDILAQIASYYHSNLTEPITDPVELALFDNFKTYLIDLKFDGTSCKLLQRYSHWHCKEGFLQGFKNKLIPDEFSNTRQVAPCRIVLTGPPLSGKSFIASAVADHYDVPHLTLKRAIDVYFAQDATLVQDIKAIEENFDDEAFQPEPADPKGKKKGDPLKDKVDAMDPEDPTTALKKSLFALRSHKLKILPDPNDQGSKKKGGNKKKKGEEEEEELPQRGIRYENQVVQAAFKYMLSKPEYMNHGWVIDGYPKTIDDVNALFAYPPPLKEVDESAAKKKKGAPAEPEYDLDAPRVANPDTLPNYVFQLTVDNVEEFVRHNYERFIEEEDKQTYHYCEQSIPRRIKEWEERDNLIDYLKDLKTKDEQTTTTLSVPITKEQSLLSILKHVTEILGEPTNYNTFSNQELLQKLEQHVIENQTKKPSLSSKPDESVEKQGDEQVKPLPVVDNTVHIEQKEEAELAERAHDVREWMVENVMTTLTRAMVELATVQPKKPFAYLAANLEEEAS